MVASHRSARQIPHLHRHAGPLLVWRNWAFILGILILEHVMLATDRVPAERIGWVWKILAVLIVFIVVLWPVFDQSGTHVLWQWGWLRLTQENLLMRR